MTGARLVSPVLVARDRELAAFRADLMMQGFALNILLFSLTVLAFLALLASARRNGSLMQTGE